MRSLTVSLCLACCTMGVTTGCGAREALTVEPSEPPRLSPPLDPAEASATQRAPAPPAPLQPTSGQNAPVGRATPENPVPPCRVAEWTEAPAVDLASVRAASVRAPRRLPASVSSPVFTTDGSRLVYPVSGGGFECTDLRRLRSEAVEALGAPTDDGAVLLARPGESTELARLSYASARHAGITPTHIRLNEDRLLARSISPHAVPHRVTWDLLTVLVANRLMIADPATQSQRPALPPDVQLADAPINVAATGHVAFVGSDGRPYVADLGGEIPRCMTVEATTGPVTQRANRRLAVTQGGRFLLYATPATTTAESTDPGFDFLLVDLSQATAKHLATARGTQDMMITAVGGEDRFLIAIHWDHRDRMGIYDVNATIGRIRRLGREHSGFTHRLLVSPNGRHAVFQTGMPVLTRPAARPPRPPRPPPPPNSDEFRDPRPRLGCDVYGCPSGACGWMNNGCGGQQYCGDCPQQGQQLPIRRQRNEGTFLMRLP